MKRYLYLFPLMALTAATFTLAACDDNKTEDTATTEQTAPVETVTTPAPETTTDSAAPPATSAIMHAEGATAYATTSSNGSVFLTLHNPQSMSDKLIGATTDVADLAEIHETSTDASGIMQMRKVDAIEVQPGQQVDLTPQSYHLMLIRLKTPLEAGKEFQVTLDFENAPDVTLPVTVTSPVAAPAGQPPAAAAEPTTTDEPMPVEDATTPPVTSEEPVAPAPAPTTDAAPAGDAHSGH